MNPPQRALAALVAAGLCVGVTAACGRGEQSGPNESGSANSDVRIAIVTRDFTNPYWAALRDGALAEGKAAGVRVTVQAGENETDSNGENAKISTLAGQDYNCFGVVPVNATNVITPLVPVARKNVPILNLGACRRIGGVGECIVTVRCVTNGRRVDGDAPTFGRSPEFRREQ